MLQEFLLTTPDAPTGWVLVQGHLGRRGRYLRSSLRVRRADPGPTEDFPLPVLVDGRIHELIELTGNPRELWWRPPEVGDYDQSQLTVRPIGWLGRTARMLVRVLRTYARLSEDERQECGLTLPGALFDLRGAYRTCTSFLVRMRDQPYPQWVERNDTLDERDRRLIAADIERFGRHPRFHVLVAAHRSTRDDMERTLASLRDQIYRHFDYTVLEPAGVLADSVVPDSMDSWLAAFNARLAAGQAGDWIILARAGDTLPPHSLYWFAREIQARPEAAILYSDDDRADDEGRRSDPRFKPDWSLEHFRAAHYVGAAAALRGSAVAAAGGISAACCRHGNYDLLLRAADAGAAGIAHIPAVLLHRGEAAAGTDWESPQWCSTALRAHLVRNGVAADVAATAQGARRIRYRLPDPPPLVSIIVPTRDAARLLEQCIRSVLEKTTYPRFEIIVVDNRSTEPAALACLARFATHPSVRVLRYPRRFNFSAINNFAVRRARGEALCLLNNDTEVISPDWLEEMVGHLVQARVGAVGAKLYYPDGRVQHAGVTVGPGGCATHLHLDLERGTGGYCGRAGIAQELSAVTGACLLTWKDAYQALGGLNETALTVAFNDIDYCLRLQEAGYRVVFTPHAELYHHESATRGDDAPLARRLRARREVKYMRRRWKSRMRHDPYYNPNLSYRRPDFALGESARVKKPWR